MSKQVSLSASDISCDHCDMTIKRELASVDGVEAVEVDVSAKRVDLTVRDDAALERAKALLDEIGYPATEAN
jgi:copper chaperone